MNRYLILADKALAHEVERVEAVEPVVTPENTPVVTVENIPEFTPATTPVDLAAAWALMVAELDADPTFPAAAVEALRVARVEWAASGP